MAEIARSFHDLNYIDTLSCMDSPVHRIDPRAKLATFLIFAVCVVSFGKYEVSALLPYFFFPAVIIPLARIPARYFAGKIVFLLPFAVLIGIFNPLYDRETLLSIAGLPVSGGMISFVSILIRFILTILAALMLVAVTGFTGVCMALERFGVPKTFTTQLMMLYRYIFVLTSEGMRMARARDLRSVGRKGSGLKVYGSLIGYLLIRTWNRAQRIHMAMLSRGYRGDFFLRRPLRITSADIAFGLGWSAVFITLRFINLPRIAGQLIMGVLS
ncbi:MAG TPA: cobalt ECF transporter T component CbiQ [Deltaproteobacteria bacterium]|nr:cobalt ECF transporter T component CbiQ [Deltaproteobacteria bacterium]